jgi:hypothetical protein
MNPGAQVRISLASVGAILLCPPEVPHQQQQPMAVSPVNPAFRSLLVALAAPDAPRSTGACPALAMVPSPILARGSSETVLVKVPVDGCGFAQDGVQQAISRIRAAGG